MMHKVLVLFGLTLATLVSLASPAQCQKFVAPPVNGQLVDNAVNVIYDPADGGLVMQATGNGSNGSPLMVTTLELQSAGAFNPDGTCDQFKAGAFGVATASKMFILRAGADAVAETCVGTVMPLGLTTFDAASAVITKVDGSVTPSGKLPAAPGGGPYLHVVPEPSSVLLAVFGLLGLIGLRRK